jgi:nitrogenase molybdenum-iron protein alpha/beta subunit
VSIDGDEAGPGCEDAEWAPLAHERFDIPYRHPYHLGLYMAVNAIPGCYAIIDGPDCLYRKAEWIHGKHDRCSTLLDAGARHRIVPTMMHSGELIKSKGEEVRARLLRVAQLPRAELMLVNSMPHVQIIGTQYDKIIAEVEAEIPCPIIEVPSRALEGDWLEGYAEVLTSLAERLPLARAPRPSPDKVAIIGVLMDRTEADHGANVDELERCVRGLGLEPVSTWLGDRGPASLARAAEAGILLALPHGREAAEAFARRTGASVVAVGQPFGFAATIRMLRALARASGRAAEAEAFIAAELRRLLPRLEWFVSSVFLGRRVAFLGDPTLFDGLLDGLSELGVQVVYLCASARRPAHGVELDEAVHGQRPPTCFAPPRSTLARHLARLAPELDLIIGASELPAREAEIAGVDLFEFGFPCFYRHAIFDAPFLGFRGWAWFAQEVANLLIRRPR